MKVEKPTAVFEVTPRAKANAMFPLEAKTLKKVQAILSGTWVPSRFNVAVDLPGDLKAVYNTFTAALTIQKHASWRRYLEPGSEYQVLGDSVPEPIYLLYSKGFFVNKDIDEIELVRQKYFSARHSNSILKLTVLPTLACNLHCHYCFEGKAQTIHNSKIMSEEIQDAVTLYINILAEGKKRVQIVWFGGEPLLTPKTIERISAQIIPNFDRAGINYHAVVSSNGTLLNQDAISQLQRCRISQIQVTIDVPKEMKQDYHGVDTLEKVLDKISIAAEKLEMHLRINLSRDDEKEFDELYDGLIRRNLHNMLKSIHIGHISVPENGWEGCAVDRVPSRLYLKVINRETVKAKALGLPLMQFHSLVDSTPNACSATCESSKVIGPDGLLYKCVDDAGLVERAYGSVFLEKPVKPDNLLPWLTYDWFKYDRCKECPVLPQCAGGCAHKRLFQSDSLKEEDFCYWHIRGDLENRIREYAIGMSS